MEFRKDDDGNLHILGPWEEQTEFAQELFNHADPRWLSREGELVNIVTAEGVATYRIFETKPDAPVNGDYIHRARLIGVAEPPQ